MPLDRQDIEKRDFPIGRRGYDPDADFITLTRGTDARRLNLNDPGRSLLVLKPTGQAVKTEISTW